MDSQESAEKRQHIRAPIELKVEYKKLNTFFADYTRNISKGGTFIKTDKPLPVGTEFLFRLVIPKVTQPIEISGEVIWTNEPGNHSHPEVADSGMGIRFIYRDDHQREDFEKMVEGMLRDSLGEHLYRKLLGKDSAPSSDKK
jgi:type IV pilus assembly protein PilZ